MSLQIWLPLTEDLGNKGLSDLTTFTSKDLTVNASGKIGKCYSGWGIFHLEEEILTESFSIATWIRSSAFGQYNDVIACKNIDGVAHRFYLSIYNGSILNFNVNGTNANGNRLEYSFENDIWYHIAATYDGSVSRIYVNGTMIQEQAEPDTYLEGMTNLCVGCRSNNEAGTAPAAQNSHTSYNDFRIYDHCLSKKEVKELSKALIAHYPLNDKIGNPNLVAGVVGNSISLLHKEGVTVSTEDNCIKAEFEGTSNNRFYAFNDPETWVKDETYTVSFYAKTDTEGLALQFSRSMADYAPDVTLTSDYAYYQIQITSNNTVSGGTLTVQSTIPGTVYIKLIKLEKGSPATPWVPNVADDEYADLGLDDVTVYDCSGYRNNGEDTGCVLNVDSPRYNSCTEFDGVNYITIPNDAYPVILSNDFTISFWTKSYEDGNRSIYFSNYSIAGGGGFFCIEKYTNDQFRFWWNNGSPDKKFNNTKIEEADGWVHIALVKEGNVATVYKNGVLSESNTNENYTAVSLPTTATTFRLGADGRTTSAYLLEGCMSDFRIYATALSAEDIKELYETSASIDQNGNTWAYEFMEV